MCSFYFNTRKIEDIEEINFYLKFRGPDATIVKHINGHTYLHNLLSLTGDFTFQPLEENGIVCMFNGEIYNYKDFNEEYGSDADCIIPLYQTYGPAFTRQLDGEFSILVVDYISRKIVISSDVFKTKPLFYSYGESGFSCSSYSSPLRRQQHGEIHKASPNTTYVFDLDTLSPIDKFEIFSFDLSQHKKSFDDWGIAFSKAIEKRVRNTRSKVFIGLSSGYDSGLIYSELLKTGAPFNTYTLTGSESEDILSKRFALSVGHDVTHRTVGKNSDTYNAHHGEIVRKTEEFRYTISSSSSNYNEFGTLLTDDYGANHFSIICDMAERDDCRICLSGTGADEIISDYGWNGNKMYQHSNFGGLFPPDLSTIFPWNSFYGSTLESYIAKEEYVGGSYGIEMRYPFLDTAVVQEFLWLSAELKNQSYKSPIDYFLSKNRIPYEKGVKKGF